MSLHHLFCLNPALAGETETPFALELDPADRNHIKALRLKAGEHIAVVDASTDYFEVEIASIEAERIWVRIAQHLDHAPQTTPVTLVQGLAKGEKMDAVLRQATELGIAGFAPAIMERSVVQLDAKKTAKRHDRACLIARSAALQSGRTTIPDLDPARPLGDIVATWTERDAVLLFWEEAAEEATSRTLFTALEQNRELGAIERFWIVIGPEGGIAPAEIDAMKRSSARVFTLTLGPTILRTETAGVVATALVLNELRACSEARR